MATATQSEHWPCSLEEYHSDAPGSVSHSELDTFIDSPNRYYRRYVTREYPGKPTNAMEIGQVFHDLMLNDRMTNGYMVIPKDVLASNGAKSGNKWKDFAEENSDKILLKAEEEKFLLSMGDAVFQHPAAATLFGGEGRDEYSIRWTDEATGIVCRCRPDRWHLGKNVLIDLKSCADVSAEGFAKACLRFGYHRQVAWYQDGIKALTGDLLPFVFVAVEKEPPYDCEVFELDQTFVDLGRIENRDALKRYAACSDSGVWRKEHHGKVLTISAPAWAFRNEWEAE